MLLRQASNSAWILMPTQKGPLDSAEFPERSKNMYWIDVDDAVPAPVRLQANRVVALLRLGKQTACFLNALFQPL